MYLTSMKLTKLATKVLVSGWKQNDW